MLDRYRPMYPYPDKRRNLGTLERRMIKTSFKEKAILRSLGIILEVFSHATEVTFREVEEHWRSRTGIQNEAMVRVQLKHLIEEEAIEETGKGIYRIRE